MVDILIVEDNVFFRQSFKKILAARFPETDITEAGTGREALEKCTKMNPDLIFLDINLPQVNGLEVCRFIRKNNPATVIFILTNFNLPEYRQAAFKSGADHFFSKDTSQEEILSRVDSELREKSLRPHRTPIKPSELS